MTGMKKLTVAICNFAKGPKSIKRRERFGLPEVTNIATCWEKIIAP
jgi:hypothetical protein